MHVAVYLPLLLAVLVVPVLVPLSRWCSPWLGTWLLVVSAVTVAGTSSIVLGLLALAGLATVPTLAVWEDWSPLVVANSDFVSLPIGLLACGCLLAGGCAVLRCAVRCGRSLTHSYREAANLDSSLVVLDDPEPIAYALPGAGGHIVVSTAMLRGLTGIQRRALLAHERAHLTHRHHLFIAVVRVVTTVNPLLLPLRGALAYTLERWADESAAAVIGDRRATAQAIGRAALILSKRSTPDELVLAAAAGPVPRRVAALLGEPAPVGSSVPRRPLITLAVVATVGVLAMITACTAEATTDLHEDLELASCAPHQVREAPHHCEEIVERYG